MSAILWGAASAYLMFAAFLFPYYAVSSPVTAGDVNWVCTKQKRVGDSLPERYVCTQWTDKRSNEVKP